MADISKITLPSGTVYNIKDAQARQDIADIESSITGAMHYVGITTTALTDGSTTATLTIDGETKTFTSSDAGAVVIYDEKEFVWNGTKWQEFGSTGSLKALAFKDTASATYQPAGTVSTPTFSGTTFTSTGSFTPNGAITFGVSSTQGEHSVKYVSALGTKSFSGTPATITTTVRAAGTVTAPTITKTTAGSTTTVNSITDVGTLPTFTVSSENLTITAGTLPTKGSNTTVKTGDAVYEASAPTFEGTDVTGSASYTPQGSVTVGSTVNYLTGFFTGSSGSISVSGKPTGTISQPTFTGTEATITVS